MLLLKLSLRPWKLAPASHLFSSVAVGFLLLLVGFLFWMQTGLRPLVARLQGEQVVTAYLDPSVDAKDETKLTQASMLSSKNVIASYATAWASIDMDESLDAATRGCKHEQQALACADVLCVLGATVSARRGP